MTQSLPNFDQLLTSFNQPVKVKKIVFSKQKNAIEVHIQATEPVAFSRVVEAEK